MTTTPDFRAHCANLVELLEDEWSGCSVQPEALKRARAALATPPPEPPTDEELMALAVAVFENPFATDKDYARAVLERWGHR